MWRYLRVCAALLAAAVLLASCSNFSEKRKYRKAGIGTDLYTANLGQETELLELYFGYICKQAGIPTQSYKNGSYRCLFDKMQLNREYVRAFVIQGMNDIDRRCDAYLAWLDNKRRSLKPKLQQVSAVRTATEAIMGEITVGKHSLEIVGIAFGLLTSTITNRNSRLLFEIDGTTVQSLVQTSRRKYRYGLPKTIGSKPEAVYEIRNYLNICLPHTIETNINRAGTGQEKTVEETNFREATQIPKDSESETKKQKQTAKNIINALSELEKKASIQDGIEIQNNLCVKPKDGNFGNKTREAINLLEQALRSNGQIGSFITLNKQLDTQVEWDMARNADHCEKHSLGYKTAFEKFFYTDKTEISGNNGLQGLLKRYSAFEEAAAVKSAIGASPLNSGSFDPVTRSAIKAAKKTVTPNEVQNDVVTPEFQKSLEEKVITLEN